MVMKTQTLAISLVLLLIAVAALPGLSFSLSSSVTSYNNSVTCIDNNQYGISIPSGEHIAEKVSSVAGIQSTSNTKVDSIIEISNGSSDGCFSSGKGQVDTIVLTQDVSFKIFIQSSDPKGLSVWVNDVKYTPVATGGYLLEPNNGNNGSVVASLDKGTVFGGSKDMTIEIESNGNASDSDGNKVYIYFVMFSDNVTQ